ncbi:hypothetical protein [Nonomuraea dietziae]|uniref:hypothetical protein n=1 Tax=Nonomuraea dietziae TaxID=65515 RepID=UPI0031E29762
MEEGRLPRREVRGERAWQRGGGQDEGQGKPRDEVGGRRSRAAPSAARVAGAARIAVPEASAPYAAARAVGSTGTLDEPGLSVTG